MKILYIGHEMDLNGASKSLLNIMDTLDDSYEIYVLTAFDSGPFYEELKKRKVTVLVYPFYRWSERKASWLGWVKRKLLWYFHRRYVNRRTAKKVAARALNEGIDIIHTNTGVLDIGALIHQYSGIRHVWHIREFGDLDFQMYPLVSAKEYTSRMNRGADRFICISQAVYEHYPFLDTRKKRVIYNGVDRRNVLEAHCSGDGPVQLLIAGRISPEKGQMDAIRGCRKLIQRGIDGFVLNIAGSGQLEEPVPPELEGHVRFHGQVKDMPQLRKSMDVELLCSRAEAFGRVTAEAMLGGIPVVGSNAGGTRELIRDGYNGLLYEAGNTDDLAEKIGMLLRSPGKRKEMGANAQEYALKHFTIERCAAEICGVYNEVLGR